MVCVDIVVFAVERIGLDGRAADPGVHPPGDGATSTSEQCDFCVVCKALRVTELRREGHWEPPVSAPGSRC